VALLARLDQLQAEEEALEALPDTTGISWQPTGRSVAEASDLAIRREILTTWVSHVTIKAVGRGCTQSFDARRVDVTWHAHAIEALADLVG